ncbi:MAG: NADH-quinone oxidoreductase subunit A [Bacteroidales bacterium]|nr:NADH-quinone oxidoreductase subunit A [Bacteroidales bacterium]
MTTPPPVLTPAGLEPAFDLATYYPMLIFAAVILSMACGIVAATHIPFLKPRNPTKTKQMPYESGMDPIGSARMQFDVKFYLIAILFLVFDVELLFLYPWAVSAYNTTGGWQSRYGDLVFLEILAFMVTLTLAYLYAWRKGVFQWR